MVVASPVTTLPVDSVTGNDFEVISDGTHNWDGRQVRLREYVMATSADKQPGGGDRMAIAMHWRHAGYAADVVLHLYERRFYRVTVIDNG